MWICCLVGWLFLLVFCVLLLLNLCVRLFVCCCVVISWENFYRLLGGCYEIEVIICRSVFWICVVCVRDVVWWCCDRRMIMVCFCGS